MNNTATSGREILTAIDGDIRSVYNTHLDNRERRALWMPSDLFPEDFVAQPLNPNDKAMLVLNLLTEDGLPYFLALLVHHLGPQHAIWDWSREWTAEEDRHGEAIGMYLKHALTNQEMAAVERLRFEYLRNGFWPGWTDPIELIAYVVLQEKATQVSHAGIARSTAHHDPVITKILGKIAGEEAGHHTAYAGFFDAVLRSDPSHGIEALCSAIKTFTMPGKSIPDFDAMSTAQELSGVFGPAQFAEIIENLAERISLYNLSGLSVTADKAREKIFTMVRALKRKAGMLDDKKRDWQNISVSFLEETIVV